MTNLNYLNDGWQMLVAYLNIMTDLGVRAVSVVPGVGRVAVGHKRSAEGLKLST